jgi:gamma-glutamylcysteine synthetase
VIDSEDPEAALAAHRSPRLRELRLHQGTVWRWNRAIYDPADGGHLRVEMRALPAGPTVQDMVANAAFQIGLALDAAAHGEEDDWRQTTEFESVHSDFYRAAREGIDVSIDWPRTLGGPGRAVPIRELMPTLLSRAESGLTRRGVDASDASELLSIIERRAGSGQTGAAWQRETLAKAEATRPRQEAIAYMFHAYMECSYRGEPVDCWRDQS